MFPTNNVQLSRSQPFVVTLTNVNGMFATFPVTYELEIRNASTNQVVGTNRKFAASSGTTTSFTVTDDLAFETNHAARVRATYRNSVGPWSAVGTFRTGPRAVLNTQTGEVFDPLTEGFTVGKQRGGTFIQGVGWQAAEPRAMASTTTSPPASTAGSSSTSPISARAKASAASGT